MRPEAYLCYPYHHGRRPSVLPSHRAVTSPPDFRCSRSRPPVARFSDVVDLLKTASPFFSTIPKARTAKIVRTIIDIVSKVPDSLELQDVLCRQVVAWCKAEKRNFLRQRIQSRQAGLVSIAKGEELVGQGIDFPLCLTIIQVCYIFPPSDFNPFGLVVRWSRLLMECHNWCFPLLFTSSR